MGSETIFYFFDNQDSNITYIHIDMNLSTPAQENSEIIITCGDYFKVIENNRSTELKIDIPVKNGNNEIVIE